MKETLQDLKTRRSCRKFKAEQIREEDLNAILEAGMYAPTGRNLQSPVIVVLQDPDTIQAVSRLNAEAGGMDMDPFYGAPTVIVVLARRSVRTYVADGNMVIANLLNAAHAVGVDSCYIFRAKEVFDSPEGRALLAKWGVEDDYEGIGNVILGYGLPDGIRPAGPRRDNYVIRV